MKRFKELKSHLQLLKLGITNVFTRLPIKWWNLLTSIAIEREILPSSIKITNHG